jgi:integrase
MVMIGYHLGLRIQDCATLRWQDVDFDRKVIGHRPQKERRDRASKKIESYMPPELRTFLGQMKPRMLNPARPLFPSLCDKKSGGAFGLSLAFRKLLDEAKVEYKDVSNGKGRKFYDLGFHSLRHTCVSVMANAGVPQELRKEHVGHDSDVHKRYTHLDIQTFETALAAVPRLLAE